MANNQTISSPATKIKLLDKRILDLLDNILDHQVIAQQLLTHCLLQIGDNLYRLLEIEYYDLDDPYTHKDATQYIPNRWYFHRKGGTYKGLDITCKNGSFLLRAIQDITSKEIIEGPSLVVDHLLATLNYENVQELRDDFTHPAQRNTTFRINWSELRDDIIYTSRRVGINPPDSPREDEEKRKEYAAMRRRYLVAPDLLKKGRKLVVEDLKSDGIQKSELMKIFKTTNGRFL